MPEQSVVCVCSEVVCFWGRPHVVEALHEGEEVLADLLPELFLQLDLLLLHPERHLARTDSR